MTTTPTPALPDLSGYVVKVHGRHTETWTGTTLAAAFTVAYSLGRAMAAVAPRGYKLTISRMESNGRVLRRPLVSVTGPDIMAALRNRAIELTGNVHARPDTTQEWWMTERNA